MWASGQAHLSKPLLQAVRRLLAVLLSCAGGLDLLLRNPIPTGALLKALDPASDPYGPPLPQDQEPARWAIFAVLCCCLFATFILGVCLHATPSHNGPLRRRLPRYEFFCMSKVTMQIID